MLIMCRTYVQIENRYFAGSTSLYNKNKNNMQIFKFSVMTPTYHQHNELGTYYAVNYQTRQ